MHFYKNFQNIFHLTFFFLLMFFYSQEVYAQFEERAAILQAAILVEPVPQPAQYKTEKIQPGQSVKISVLIENIGDSLSPSSKLYVRYAFAKPLEKDPSSVLFETKKLDLPPIQPNSSIEVPFEETHKWPSLPDFISQDWGMREYQAIIEVENQEKIIGTLAITFSAYYYPGIRKEMPVKLFIK